LQKTRGKCARRDVAAHMGKHNIKGTTEGNIRGAKFTTFGKKTGVHKILAKGTQKAP